MSIGGKGRKGGKGEPKPDKVKMKKFNVGVSAQVTGGAG